MRVKFAGHEEHVIGGVHDHRRRDQKSGIVDDINGEDMPQSEPGDDGSDLEQVGYGLVGAIVHGLKIGGTGLLGGPFGALAPRRHAPLETPSSDERDS